MSYSDYSAAGIRTPTTKPQQPIADPPLLSLPPSLPKQAFLNDGFLDSQRPAEPVARSLTNNDHSIIPSSLGGQGGIKMGQSPTILSILSGQDPNNPSMSYRANNTGGTSMIASSRTYATTTIPQNHHPQQQFSPQGYNNFAQYPPPQPIHQGDNEEEDDMSDSEMMGDDYQFPFNLEDDQ